MSALDTQVAGSHYKDMKIQPAEFIEANGLSFLEGCIIKRICRWRKKDGVQDLEKIKHEVDLLIELHKREGDTVKPETFTVPKCDESKDKEDVLMTVSINAKSFAAELLARHNKVATTLYMPQWMYVFLGAPAKICGLDVRVALNLTDGAIAVGKHGYDTLICGRI